MSSAQSGCASGVQGQEFRKLVAAAPAAENGEIGHIGRTTRRKPRKAGSVIRMGFEATTSSLKGKRLVLFPNSLVRLFARQGAARLDALRAGGTTEGLRDRMLSFDELNALLGTAEVLESGRRYAGERDPG